MKKTIASIVILVSALLSGCGEGPNGFTVVGNPPAIETSRPTNAAAMLERGLREQPYWKGDGGDRPLYVRFDPDSDRAYLVDEGRVEIEFPYTIDRWGTLTATAEGAAGIVIRSYDGEDGIVVEMEADEQLLPFAPVSEQAYLDFLSYYEAVTTIRRWVEIVQGCGPSCAARFQSGLHTVIPHFAPAP